MPVKRVKDMSKCVAQFRLLADEKPYYWHVYLWDSTDSLLDNVDPRLRSDSKENEVTKACHCSMRIMLDPETGQPVPSNKLGELHFVKRQWDLEIVAHELMHAVMHRIRNLCEPSMDQLKDDFAMQYEEGICYEFGRWVDQVYRHLWGIDPHPGWEKIN